VARVLLIEDDPDQRELRTTVLENAGHEVVATGCAVEALSLVRQMRPSCLLMDLKLPDAADGLALIRGVRENDGETPIFVLTGATRELSKAPERPLVQAVFRKASDLAKMLARVRQLDRA
jgi:CheY-like chemotaxis protein